VAQDVPDALSGATAAGTQEQRAGAPTEMMATIVSSVEPRPMVSPCHATESRPSRYKQRPAVRNGSPSSRA